MGSGHVEVHTWTCSDRGEGRERMCLELLNNDWSDPCTGTCQGVARTVFLFGVLCWDSVLTFIFWLYAYGVKVLTPGLCLVTDPLSNSEYHHLGTKSYAVPHLSQCQLWEFRSSAPGSSKYVPTLASVMSLSPHFHTMWILVCDSVVGIVRATASLEGVSGCSGTFTLTGMLSSKAASLKLDWALRWACKRRLRPWYLIS